MLVLTGLAGSGKTERLHELAAAGEQVLDLEGLACHRGSAFGGIGAGAAAESRCDLRPSWLRPWPRVAPDRPLWVEDEGPFIGSVGVPEWLQAEIASAPVVEVEASWDERVSRLARLYGGAAPEELLRALDRSRRRLGAERTATAEACVRGGDVRGAIAAVLPFYDAAYEHRVGALGRRVVGRTRVGGPPL